MTDLERKSGGVDGTRTRDPSFEINNLLYCSNDPASPQTPTIPTFCTEFCTSSIGERHEICLSGRRKGHCIANIT